MPPRYAYWTILVGDQPTAFRAGAQEDLMPTFKRLQAKHADAKMMWFQNGKLWPSRIDAQEAMRARGEMGRRGDDRQLARRSSSEGGSGFRSRDRDFKPNTRSEKPEWRPKSEAEGRGPRRSAEREGGPDWKPRGKPVGESFSSPGGERKERREPGEKLDWKPKGEFTPAPKRSEKPEWKPKGSFDRDRKPDWKPKGFAAEGRESRRSSFTSEGGKPKGSFDRKPEWKPRGKNVGANFSSPGGDRREKPEWKPKGTFDRKSEWKPRTESGTRNSEPGTAKRKWVPKAEYKKSLGIEAKRDEKWRPGGEHRDPRQKYKDAKKAKWSKFKQNIRKRWEAKTPKKKTE